MISSLITTSINSDSGFLGRSSSWIIVLGRTKYRQAASSIRRRIEIAASEVSHIHSICDSAVLAYSGCAVLTLEHLADLFDKYRSAWPAAVREFSIGGRLFHFNSKPAIMGVVNLSPDSWYRESVCLSTESAVRRSRVLSEQGADIIDLGAESTLAHADRLDDAGQKSRLLPVIRELRAAKILVSIETYQPEVTRDGLASGANVLNLTGNETSDDVFRMVADHDAAVVLCYVQGRNVRDVQDFDFCADPISDMHEYFGRKIEQATRNGVNRLFVDPGLGFYYRNLQDSARRVQHQMTVFLNSFRLRSLGFPVCNALPHAFEYFREEVRSAEPFFAVMAAIGRTDLFRTHEVSRVRAVLDTLGAYPIGSAPAE